MFSIHSIEATVKLPCMCLFITLDCNYFDSSFVNSRTDCQVFEQLFI